MSQTVFVSMMTKRPDDAAAGIYDFGCDEGTHSGMLLMLRNPVHHGGGYDIWIHTAQFEAPCRAGLVPWKAGMLWLLLECSMFGACRTC